MGGPGYLFGAVALGLAGGGLLLWWKSKQNDPCAGLSGEELLICKGAGIAGDVLNVLADAGKALTTSPDDGFANEAQRRSAINDGLNGPPDTSVSGDVTGYTGNVWGWASWRMPVSWNVRTLRYANGCEPFYAAPGWSKCKAGTLDMYEMAIEGAAGGGLDNAKLLGDSEARTVSVFETPADLAAAIAKNQSAHDNSDDSHWYQIGLGEGFDPTPLEKLNKDNYGTGASGDPLTQGPWVDGDGSIWWLVRGQRFKGVAGQVPLAIAMRARGPMVAGQTQADVDAKIRALTDAQAVSLIAVGSYGAGGGTGTTTTYNGCAAIIADPTLTWDGQGWARLKVGAKRNLGPCAGAKPNTNASGQTKANTTTTVGIGTTFGFGILGL